MSTDSAVAQDPSLLTIGELAKATGVAVERLRMWETRYGFPVAERLPSGHRRYSPAVVDDVLTVVRLQESGVRLDQAVARTRRPVEEVTSVFAQLRRGFGHLTPIRLRKSTLIALSWAIEDECVAQAQRPLLIGAFQYARNFRPAASRWAELARVATTTLVLVDTGGEPLAVADDITLVDLPADSLMSREWTVVCDAPDFPAALAAWEVPGQEDVPDLERVYEAVWTIEPRAVREASRAALLVAGRAGCEEAPGLLYRLAETPEPGVGDLTAVSTLFNRVVAYLDRGVS